MSPAAIISKSTGLNVQTCRNLEFTLVFASYPRQLVVCRSTATRAKDDVHRVQLTSLTPATGSSTRSGPGLRPWSAKISSAVAPSRT
jgi:hypothetical protein